jgi:hypothetical protein
MYLRYQSSSQRTGVMHHAHSSQLTAYWSHASRTQQPAHSVLEACITHTAASSQRTGVMHHAHSSQGTAAPDLPQQHAARATLSGLLACRHAAWPHLELVDHRLCAAPAQQLLQVCLAVVAHSYGPEPACSTPGRGRQRESVSRAGQCCKCTCTAMSDDSSTWQQADSVVASWQASAWAPPWQQHQGQHGRATASAHHLRHAHA